MVMIGGQVWQDEQAYLEFMSRETSQKALSKTDIMESDLERLKKAVQDKEGHFEMSLRADNNVLIYPGERKIITVGISPELLRDYNSYIEALHSLEYNSWLRVYPILTPIYNKMGVTMINHAQMCIAKETRVWNLTRGYNGVYIRDIDRLDETDSEELLHTAYSISSGDEIATLILKRR